MVTMSVAGGRISDGAAPRLKDIRMDSRLRIMDACANRASEALRTMEDAARFHLGDGDLSSRLKGLRHELRALVKSVPGGELALAASRDTPGDVGAGIRGIGESSRGGMRAVAIAAGKRAGEALRTLEEVAKTMEQPDGAPGRDTPLWSRLEGLRYRLYDAERRLMLAMGTGRGVQWRLCVLITESLCRHPWMDVARQSIAGGADCLQLREPSLPDREILGRARALRGLIDQVAAGGAPRRPGLIINNRVDLALAAGADGVHLGTDDLPIEDARRLCGDRLLIGASTHDLHEARHAAAAGADYCGVGAMFPGTTKVRLASGPEYLGAFLREFGHMPHLAIGGITPDNAGPLVSAGARGLAVSSAVCGAEDPGGVCRRLVAILEHGSTAGSA